MTLYPNDTRPDLTFTDPKARRAVREETRRCIRQARRAKDARLWAWMQD